MTLNRGGCPPLETIGAFLDGRLEGPARETMAEHLAECETCYFVFSEAAAIPRETIVVAEDEDERTRRRIAETRRRVMWAAGVGLAAAAILLLAVNVYWLAGRPADNPALDDLVAAVGSERIIEPRLTGGFAYGPLRTVRSAQPAAGALSPDVRIAIARIEKETEGSTSASSRHARGIAALISGDADRAIGLLAEAAELQPGDARMLNDLASAWLVRAGRDGRADDLSRALATTNRALERDRLLPEALFNRAHALERLGRLDDARLAWQAYLAIDDRSGWADEVRARLRTLNGHP